MRNPNGGQERDVKACADAELVDRYRASETAATSAEGYRLVWYHSSRQAECDARARARRLERTWEDLAELQAKLKAPRTRYRRRAPVTEAVEAILQARGTTGWVVVAIDEREEAIYRHPKVAECIVVGVTDPYRGETVKAYVAPLPGQVIDKDELIAFLKDKLSPIEMPKLIEFRPSLPKTLIGKPSKKALLEEEAAKAAVQR